MRFWSMMNWVAWALSGLILLLLISDFIKVERQRKADSSYEGK